MLGFDPKLIFVTNEALMVGVEKEIGDDVFRRLGGCDRVGKVLGSKEEEWTAQELAPLVLPPALPAEKICLGISCVNVPRDFGSRLARDLKKIVKGMGGRLKFIEPRKGARLNSAQVIFNDLLSEPHAELTIINNGKTHYAVKTVLVQDIQSYELRDTARPARNARVGMLPPKLAQIMVNISASHYSAHGHDARNPLTVFDPFCGTGTILQEAWLMGYQAIGTDESKEMINATSHNVVWIKDKFSPDMDLYPRYSLHDVRMPFSTEMSGSIDVIATEPHLGKPLTSPLPQREMNKEIEMLGKLYLAAFENLKTVLKPGGSVVFLLPAWRSERRSDAFYLLPPALLDAISALGYIKGYVLPDALDGAWKRDDRSSMIYARPDALVGRELTLWKLAG